MSTPSDSSGTTRHGDESEKNEDKRDWIEFDTVLKYQVPKQEPHEGRYT